MAKSRRSPVRDNLLAICVPLSGLILTFIVSKMFFQYPEHYDYNILGQLTGLDYVLILPLLFFLGCYIAAYIGNWMTEDETSHSPLIVSFFTCIGVYAGIFLSMFFDQYISTAYLIYIITIPVTFLAVRLALMIRRDTSKRGFRSYVYSLCLVTLLLVPIVMTVRQSDPEFPHDSTLNVRDQWAKDHLNPYYSVAVDYVSKVNRIRKDVGDNMVVAPSLHSENGSVSGSAKFTLEVAGEDGTGICEIKFRYHRSGDHKYHYLRWKFKNNTTDFVTTSETAVEKRMPHTGAIHRSSVPGAVS